ncbi:MAG: FMN-binding negative transcriptional regulator [Methylococcales bacterium]|nr:FMN-binding negative transcriptional regulator [Methylococcales bacterium]
MYLPKVFEKEDKDELFEFIDQWNFGELITTFDKELFVNHVPFILDRKQNKLFGHLAVKNPQIRLLEKADDLIVVFKGADSYISPNWYDSEGMVPTWNFEVVHVYGKAKLVYGDELLTILEKLTEKHERQSEKPWKVTTIPEDRLNNLMKIIVGFEIDISRIRGKSKLSQNRSIEDRKGVITGLRAKHDRLSLIIADLMESDI